MRNFFIFILILVLIVLLFVFWPRTINAPVPSNSPSPIACTADAKICPDGSAVGRVGPNCEFAACPSISPSPLPTPSPNDITLALGQTAKVGEVKITLNSITEDSRCPADVVCIQAGRVVANVTIANSLYFVIKNISSMGPAALFDSSAVSITSVLPLRQSGKEILQSAYRITFHVETN